MFLCCIPLSSSTLTFVMQQDGSTFKASVVHRPYFYVQVKDRRAAEVESYLLTKFSSHIEKVERVEKVCSLPSLPFSVAVVVALVDRIADTNECLVHTT